MATRREDIIQALLGADESKAYLQVGGGNGAPFLAIRAGRKVAVSPRFGFDADAAGRADPAARFHMVSGEAFFGEVAPLEETFDVILLTGTRRFDDALRTFCNAVTFLSRGGAIVIDHARPRTYAAAQPTKRGFRKAGKASPNKDQWDGDIYRLVAFIATFFQGWSFASVAEEGNVVVVWREARERVPDRPVRKVARLPFEWTVDDARYKPRPLRDIVADVRRSA